MEADGSGSDQIQRQPYSSSSSTSVRSGNARDSTSSEPLINLMDIGSSEPNEPQFNQPEQDQSQNLVLKTQVCETVIMHRGNTYECISFIYIDMETSNQLDRCDIVVDVLHIQV
jgi:hypothetical protein